MLSKQDIKEKLDIKQLFKNFIDLFSRFFTDDGPKNVAALTYTTLFAVVPFFTVMYAILSIVPAFQELQGNIENFIFDNFVPATGEKVRVYLTHFASQARNLTGVGILFLVVTAIMMIMTTEEAFNNIWRVKEGRKGLQAFLLYWAVITLGPLLIGASIVLSSFLFSVPFFESEIMAGGKIILLKQLPLILSLITFIILFWALPNCKVEFKHAVIGGIITGLLFELGKKAFTYFISNFASYEFIYGAFAAVPIFLFWIYLTWWLILLGAELVATLGEMKGINRVLDQHPGLQTILILDYVWQEFSQGKSTKENHLRKYIGNQDRAIWYQIRGFLLKENLLLLDDNNNIWAGKNYAQINLAEFLLNMPWQLPDTKTWHENLANKKLTTLVDKIQLDIQTQANISLAQAFEKA